MKKVLTCLILLKKKNPSILTHEFIFLIVWCCLDSSFNITLLHKKNYCIKSISHICRIIESLRLQGTSGDSVVQKQCLNSWLHHVTQWCLLTVLVPLKCRHFTNFLGGLSQSLTTPTIINKKNYLVFRLNSVCFNLYLLIRSPQAFFRISTSSFLIYIQLKNATVLL